MKSSDKEFIVESEELLEEAASLLLSIQESPKGKGDPDTVNALFRAMHTLKGMAGIYGYRGITDISHALESLLDDVRMGRAEISGRVVDFLFKYIDVMRAVLSRSKEAGDKGEDADVSGQLGEIESFRASLMGGEAACDISGLIDGDILKVLSQYEEHRLKTNLNEGRNILLINTAFALSDFDKRLKELSDRIKPEGELISTMPTSENVPAGSIGFRLLVGTSLSRDELQRLSGFDTRALVEAPAKKRAVRETAPEPPAEAEIAQKISSSIVRVDIEKLDSILNTIEEVSLAKNSIRRIWEEMVERYGSNPLIIDLYKVSQNLERRVSDLQHQVLEIRMVPIGQMFGRVAQFIRRYAREADKKIEPGIFGEDTEIDKSLAEEVIDPIVHIIRNAIDHGLESARERKAAGKDETGMISLRAFQRGNNVVIEVQDDGRGIDLDKVMKKAVERGIFDAASEVLDYELLDLIFAPGFSTAESVSEVSGRGVGLDIVKEKLSALGGAVEVLTEKGRGSVFILTLPITLAIIKTLIVKAGRQRFAVPISAMSETLILDSGDLQFIEGREVFNLRGGMLPMARLAEMLHMATEDTDRASAIVVGAGDRRMGLLVDELGEQCTLVIKPLGGYLEEMRHFAGAAEVGRHEVIMVLDVESIIDSALNLQEGR